MRFARGLDRKSAATAAFFVAGLLAFSAGLWLIYMPAGLLFAGAASTVGALLYHVGDGRGQ